MNESDKPDLTFSKSDRREKEAWVEPTVARMRAGDAENAPNAVMGDGLLGQGS